MARVTVTLFLSATAPPVAESADLTRIPPASEIVDAAGVRWTRNEAGYPLRNGVLMPWGAVHALKYVAGFVWFWDSGGWHQVLADGKLGLGQGTEPPPVLTPINCVLSPWSEWSAWTVSSADPLMQTRSRTRTIITPPLNGGAPCGPLIEEESRAIQVNRAPVWNMADIIFEQGVPAEIDLRTRATDADGDPMTFNVETALAADLVGPFTFNDFKLSYDGRDMGLVEGDAPLLRDTGITIAADDGR
jgi:hypothetical protein